MKKKAAFITIHGMGRTELDYNHDIVSEMKDRLKSLSEHLHFGKVYYQDILQQNEDRVWNNVVRKVKWDELRKFLLFGFGDAAGLEANKEGKGSDYWLAQIAIAKELLVARDAMENNGPIVILAQSLGGQVASCYFWDANLKTARGKEPTVGIWKNIEEAASEIAPTRRLTNDEIDFLRGSTFRTFITTGCNIPIFVAAHAKEDILPIYPNNNFKWHNYYDKDDILGWPLSDLSDEYKSIVVDHQINATGGIMGWLLKSWNPMSHTQYWLDEDLLTPLEQTLRPLLQ